MYRIGNKTKTMTRSQALQTDIKGYRLGALEEDGTKRNAIYLTLNDINRDFKNVDIIILILKKGEVESQKMEIK